MKRKAVVAALTLVLFAAACGGGEDESGPLRVITHDSFAISDEVIAAFTAESGIDVEFLASGDAGTMVSQAVLIAGSPTADVMYGIDNTLVSRAVNAGVFDDYRSRLLEDVPQTLHPGTDQVTPINFGDVCLNYDKAALTSRGLDVPAQLSDLTLDDYRGALAVQNPATSSPGLAFMLATIAVFGEDGEYTWLDYWTDLRANDVVVTSGWEQAYYEEFSGGGGGDLPLVVSYASSPPAGVLFSDPMPAVAPTGNIDAGCFRQVEYAGVLAGTDRPGAAKRFIDFMLSIEFQEDLPLNMFVFPANENATLPDIFVQHVEVPTNSVRLTPAAIEANRQRWIDEWTDVFR